MERGLGQKWLGVTFAILITVTFAFVFNTVQSNTIAESFKTQYNTPSWITGVILAIITAIVIFGGVRWIANVSSAIVPVMAIFYILIVLFVLVMHIGDVIPMIISIIKVLSVWSKHSVVH